MAERESTLPDVAFDVPADTPTDWRLIAAPPCRHRPVMIRSRYRLIAPIVIFCAIAIAPATPAPAQAPAASGSESPVPIGRQAMRKFTSLFALDAEGKVDEAIAAVNQANALQRGFIPSPDLFPTLGKNARFRAFIEQLRAAEPTIAPAPVAHRLSDKEYIPEGIAYDPPTGRWFVSSLRGRLIEIDGRGRERLIDSDPSVAMGGITIDWPRRRLCVANTNGFMSGFKTTPINRVRCYALNNGKRVLQFDVPGAKQLNDLAIAPDGTVFVTDTADGKVHRRSPNGKLDVPISGMFSPNGIALDGRGHLFVADGIGIGRYRLSDGQWLPSLINDSGVNVGAIDGLAVRNGQLLGVQGFPTLGRVIALDVEGDHIRSVKVLASARQPEMLLPTTMALGRDAAFVISSTELRRLDPDGKITDGPPLDGAVILRVPLDRR